MRLSGKLAVTVGVMALGATPALAIPPQTPDNQGTAHAPATTPAGPPESTPPDNQGTENKPDTPGPHAGMPAKARAYGKLCQGESKKHVKGTHGTPFSKCVTDMAKLASGRTDNPRAACKNESKKHVAGTHGTPFSRCVSAGDRLLHHQEES